MTSYDPLETLALTALKNAASANTPPTAAELHDLAYARSLDPGQCLVLMNEILLRAQAFGLPKPSLKAHRHGELLM